jgi:hypothetical protein
MAGAAAALGVMAMAAPAWADAIDGDWCSADGRHFSIRGPDIVTPAGTPTHGDYDRHAFAYVVPDSEAGAGAAIAMVLVNEDTVHLKAQPEGQLEVWTRCEITISRGQMKRTVPPAA